ncbi:MAG TPA: aminodeoxychorismate synthase component I [Anaerolineales bacterium]|nr:aminodeoxychorismate synthase component I [Anaerolineales bacterium]
MNDIKPQGGEIRENEVLLKENGQWLYFAEPQQIITARTLDDVFPALHTIERLTQVDGWYAAGFLSYEAASAFDPAFQTRAERSDERSLRKAVEARTAGFPYLWFGIYPQPRIVPLPQPERPREILNWQPTIDRETYNSAIEQIKDHIAKGRTYQVNYTLRLEADFSSSPWDFFLHLAQRQNNHAAYVDTGRYVICSASPELFFQLDGDTILCRPMKGTIRRGRTTEEDRERSEWLRNSGKNRAENVMIVDMIRNDLGRIAKVGTVHVPRLFETERYPSLWQMTSTVAAETNHSPAEILAALFPSASITGAPKVSTMKIIAELEDTPRRIYTGSIGTIAPQRKATFNVAIRTAVIDQESGRAEYGVGGGIVWDSTSADEYAEAMLKANVLVDQPAPFSLLETMCWTPEEGFFLREKHLARMLDSANYFDIPVTKEKLEEHLEEISSSFHTPQHIRVLLDQDGNLYFEAKPFEPQADFVVLNACLARQPVDSNDVFLFHKTTRRAVYEAAREGFDEFDDVLLYNESGELTEFTIGNLVAELAGQLVTPPLACGVLPGTFRAHLMETGQVVERTIHVEQLKDCAKIFRVNSVRKWQKVELQRKPVKLRL